MKRILSGSAVLLAAACLNVGSLSAATLDCTPLAPVAVATVSNSFGSPSGATVTCGALTFSNFQAVNAGGTAVGLQVFTVSPSTYDTTSGIVNLAFNPNFSAPSGTEDIHFFFDVTAAAGFFIDGVDGGIGGTNSHYTEYACSGAGGYTSTGSGCSSTTLASFTIFSGGSQGLISFANNQSIGIIKDIETVGPGALTGFSQSFHYSSTVPEPASLSMMGLGLLGLGLIGRRKRKA